MDVSVYIIFPSYHCINAELCHGRSVPALAGVWCQGFSVSGAQRAGGPAARGVRGEIREAVGEGGYRGGVTVTSEWLGSAGEPGYVMVIIMRGRPGSLGQPLAFLSALSCTSS